MKSKPYENSFKYFEGGKKGSFYTPQYTKDQDGA